MRISKTGGFRSRPRTALASGLALVAAAAIPAVTAPAASAATAVAITVNATTGLGTVSSDAIGLNTAVYDGNMNDPGTWQLEQRPGSG